MNTSLTIPFSVFFFLCGFAHSARAQSLYDVPGFGWSSGGTVAPAQEFNFHNIQPQGGWGSDEGLRQYFAGQQDPNWQPAPPPIHGYMGNPGGSTNGDFQAGASAGGKFNPNATAAELRAQAASLKRRAQAERDSADRYKKLADEARDRGHRQIDGGLIGIGGIVANQGIIWSQRASDAEMRALDYDQKAAELLARAEATDLAITPKLKPPSEKPQR